MKIRQRVRRCFVRETPSLYSKVDMLQHDNEGRESCVPYEQLRFNHAPSMTNAEWRNYCQKEWRLLQQEERLRRRHRHQDWKAHLASRQELQNDARKTAVRDLTQHPDHAARYPARELKMLGFGHLISRVHRKPPYRERRMPLYEQTLGQPG